MSSAAAAAKCAQLGYVRASALGTASHPLLLVLVTSWLCVSSGVGVELRTLSVLGNNVARLGHRSGSRRKFESPIGKGGDAYHPDMHQQSPGWTCLKRMDLFTVWGILQSR